METKEKLSAGFGLEDIADWTGYRMPGHSARELPATEVLDRLAVRAAVFQRNGSTVVLILADVIAFDEDLERRMVTAVAKATGVPGENVLVAATHTHTGPPVFTLGDAHALESARDDLVTAGTNAAAQALQIARPVECVEVRQVENPFAINRRLFRSGGVVMEPNPDGPVEKTVTLLTFLAHRPSDSAANPVVLGHICTLPMHPTVLAPAVSTLSGDVAGALSSVLEDTDTIGGTCLMMQGASGDVRPLITDAEGRFAGGTAHDLSRIAGSLARSLARSGAIYRVRPDMLGYRRHEVKFDFAAGPAGLAGPAPPAEQAGPAAPATNQGTLKRFVAVLTFDNQLALAFLPGEPFAELALQVRRHSPYPCTVVAAHTGATVGYVPTADDFDAGGYEVAEAYGFYGYHAALARDAGQRLVDSVLSLLRR